MDSYSSVTSLKPLSSPKHYHTIIIPTTISSGKYLLLPVEVKIEKPKESATCCSSSFATKITGFKKLDQSYDWPLTSVAISKLALFCICQKTSLHLAIKQGQLNKVEELLEKGLSLDTKDHFGKVPLQYICKLEANDFRRILDVIWLSIVKHRKHVIELRRVTGLLPIHLACLRDDIWAVKVLLSANRSFVNKMTSANCNRWPNYTPLHFAVSYGSAELLNFLLNHGADPNNRDKYGNTPAHMAIGRGKIEMFHTLVKRGADPYCKTYRSLTSFRLALQSKCENAIDAVLNYTMDAPMDNKGMTPFHYCCIKALYNKVIEFINHGTDVDSRIHHFASKMAGYSPLHIAVERKDFRLLKILLDNGASGDHLNSELLTAVEMIHCRIKNEKLKLKMIEIMKDRGFEKMENLKCFVDRLDCLIDCAYDNLDEPVVIEMNPTLGGDMKDIEEKIREKLAFKKCLFMTRTEMTTLFFKYGECNCITKVTVKPNGQLKTSFIYGSFCQSIKKKVDDTVYDYYIVNDLALQTLINFGIDLGNDVNEIQLGNRLHIPKSIIYIFLRYMEIRRLLGLGGKNETFWKNKINEELSVPYNYYIEDINKLPELVKQEMELMKKFNLGSIGTLLDLLKDEHKLSQFLYRNPYFIQMFHAYEFFQKLPNCISILKLQCFKAIERWDLIQPAIRNFRKIAEKNCAGRWVDDCSELILPYLDLEDLKNLIDVYETDNIST